MDICKKNLFLSFKLNQNNYKVAIFYNYHQQYRDSSHAFLESYDVYKWCKKYICLRVSILGTGTLILNFVLLALKAQHLMA